MIRYGDPMKNTDEIPTKEMCEVAMDLCTMLLCSAMIKADYRNGQISEQELNELIPESTPNRDLAITYLKGECTNSVEYIYISMRRVINKEEAVTPEMLKVGQMLAEHLMDASCSKALGGLGGCKSLDACFSEVPEHRDLVEDYISEKIDSVGAYYIAMRRVANQTGGI
jgi:hypothetical protein